MLKKILVLGALLSGALATPTLAANIVDTAKADGSFTKLLAANQAAGTASILEGPGPFTVFAPNDAAFAKAPRDKLAMLMKPENLTKLKVTLANHVVTGLLTENQIDSGLDKAGAVVVTAANNMPLIIRREGGVLTVNGAHVIKGPMKVDNGLIYVVDAVILPAMPLQPTY
jgi:uncharacterized surface protein with fasciclin (FAS1) repeats